LTNPDLGGTGSTISRHNKFDGRCKKGKLKLFFRSEPEQM
jgi:hypothetical protein